MVNKDTYKTSSKSLDAFTPPIMVIFFTLAGAELKLEVLLSAGAIGILYVIGEQKSEDIVLFINSIYNTEDKEVLKFLEESLRLSKFHDTFLYYFVKYNKKFNEVDSSFFTSNSSFSFIHFSFIFIDVTSINSRNRGSNQYAFKSNST